MVLFAVTCLVILAVIVALLRWIAKRRTLGDVAAVVDLVERAARDALSDHARDPFLGGIPAGAPPVDGVRIVSRRLGFVQTVNCDALGRVAEDCDVDIRLAVRPGAYIDPSRPLVLTDRPLPEGADDRVRGAFVIGGSRTFEADPRFSLIALSEIGSRALSSGVNDPGTAIDVLGAAVRILAEFADTARAARPELRHPRLHVPPLAVEDLLGDTFRWIARDGAGMLEVQIRLQKGLATLAVLDPARFGAAARIRSDEAMDHAERSLPLPADLAALCALVSRLRGA